MATGIRIFLILSLISVPNFADSQSTQSKDFTLETYGCKGLYKFKYEVSKVVFTFPQSKRFLQFTPDDGLPVIVTNPANGSVRINITITNSTGVYNTEAVQVSPERCCKDQVISSRNCYDLILSCQGNCVDTIWPEYRDFYKAPDCDSKCICKYCYVGDKGQKTITVSMNTQRHLFSMLVSTNKPNTSEIVWQRGVSQAPYRLQGNMLLFPFRKDDLFKKFFNVIQGEISEIKVKGDLPPNGRASVYIEKPNEDTLLYFIWYSPLSCNTTYPGVQYLNSPIVKLLCNNPIQKKIIYNVNNTDYHMIGNEMYFKDLTISGDQLVTISAMYTDLPDSVNHTTLKFKIDAASPLVNVTGCKAMVNLKLLNYTRIRFINEPLQLFKTISTNRSYVIITVFPTSTTTILVYFNNQNIPYIMKATSKGMCCPDVITVIDTPFCVKVNLTCNLLCNRSSWPTYKNFINTGQCTNCACTFCYTGFKSGLQKLYRPLDSSTHLVPVDIPPFESKARSVIRSRRDFFNPLPLSNGSVSKIISLPKQSNFDDYFIVNKSPVYNTFQVKPDTKFPSDGRVMIYIYTQSVFTGIDNGLARGAIDITWYSPVKCEANPLKARYLNDPLVYINCTNPVKLTITYMIPGGIFLVKGKVVYLNDFTAPIPNSVSYAAMYESRTDSSTDLMRVNLLKDFSTETLLSVYGCRAVLHLSHLRYKKLNIFNSKLKLNRTIIDTPSFILTDLLEIGTTTFDLYVDEETTPSIVNATTLGMCCNETVKQENNCYTINLTCSGSCNIAVWEEYPDFYQTTNCGNCSCQYCYIGNISRSFLFYVKMNSTFHAVEIIASAIEKTTFQFNKPRRHFLTSFLLPVFDSLQRLPYPNAIPFDFSGYVNTEGMTYANLTVKKDVILPEQGSAQIYFKPIEYKRKVYEYNISWFPGITCDFQNITARYLNDPFLQINCVYTMQRDILYNISNEIVQIRNDFVYLRELTATGFYDISLTAMYKGLPESKTVFPIKFKVEDIFPPNAILTVHGCKVDFNFSPLRYEGLNLYSKIGINTTLFSRNYSTKIPAGQTTMFKLKIDGRYEFDLKATAYKFCCYGNITHDIISRCYTLEISCNNLCNGKFPDTRHFYVTHVTSKCSAFYCYRGGEGGNFKMTVPLNDYPYNYTVKMYPTQRTTEIVQFLIGTKEVGVPLLIPGGSRSYSIQPYTYAPYINITTENNLMLFKEMNPDMPEGHFNVSISFINFTVLEKFPDTLLNIQELSVYVFKKVNCTVQMFPYIDQYPRPVSQLRCTNALNIPLKYYIVNRQMWFDFEKSVVRMILPAGRAQLAEVAVEYKDLSKSLSKHVLNALAINYSISVKLKTRDSSLYPKFMESLSSMARIPRVQMRTGNIIDAYIQTTSGKGVVREIEKIFSSTEVKFLDYFVPDGAIKIMYMNASEYSRNRYVFTCYTNSTATDVTYEWYWNDVQVSRGLSSSMVNGKSQGSVVFNMLNDRDTGNVTCHIRYKSYLPDTRRLFISMMYFPKVTLNTTSNIIKNQKPVNVSCYIPPFYEMSYPILKVNGELVRGNMVSLTKESNVSCYAVNGIFHSEIKTLKISIAIGKKICPNETSNNLQWPETVAKSTANVTCIGEYTGTASRLCFTNGTWDLPNIECVKKSIVDARSTLGRIELGLGGDFETSVESLAKATKEDLNAVDIDETISAFDIASNITDKAKTVSNKDVQNLVGVISNLLAEDTKSAWIELEKKKKVSAATVMKQMDTFGKVASEKLNETTTISEKNLVLEIAKVSVRDNINFPSAKVNQSKWVQESDSNVFVPSDILESNFGVNDTVIMNAVLFRNMKELLPKYDNASSIINSYVLSISLQKPLENLTDKVILNFSHVSPGFTESSCNFWDFDINPAGGGYWSTRGCEVVKSSSKYTVCACDHLTNFAILMNPVSHKSREVLNIISIVGCSISIIALAITIIVYVIFWKHVTSEDVSKSQSVLLMNLCVSLIVAYVIFVAFVEGPREKGVCTAIAALIQYFFLVVFFTMFAEGIDMAIALTVVFASRFRRLPWLLLLSWLLPAVIVGISLGSTQTKGFGNEVFCWLTPEDNAIWSFIVPAVMIILANIVCVIFIVKALLSSYCMLRKSVKDRLRTGARAIGILTPLLGFTWLFGILAVNEELVVFEYIFTISSSLQGLFIFITYCIFNKQIQKKICKKEKLDKQVPTKPTQSTSNSENTTKITELSSSARRSDIDESLRNTDEIVVKNSIYDPHLKNRDQRVSIDDGLRKSIKPYYINPKIALYSEKL